eukprot:1155131-Pelagomonas_calceolata.AAC.1
MHVPLFPTACTALTHTSWNDAWNGSGQERDRAVVFVLSAAWMLSSAGLCLLSPHMLLVRLPDQHGIRVAAAPAPAAHAV